MMQRLWHAVRRAAHWYALGFGAAVTSLGDAELALAHLDPADLDGYARQGVADLEAWLGRFAISD